MAGKRMPGKGVGGVSERGSRAFARDEGRGFDARAWREVERLSQLERRRAIAYGRARGRL